MFINSANADFNQQLFRNTAPSDPILESYRPPSMREPIVNKTPAFHGEHTESDESEAADSSLDMGHGGDSPVAEASNATAESATATI